MSLIETQLRESDHSSSCIMKWVYGLLCFCIVLAHGIDEERAQSVIKGVSKSIDNCFKDSTKCTEKLLTDYDANGDRELDENETESAKEILKQKVYESFSQMPQRFKQDKDYSMAASFHNKQLAMTQELKQLKKCSENVYEGPDCAAIRFRADKDRNGWVDVNEEATLSKEIREAHGSH